MVSKLDGYEVVWQKMEFDTIVSAVQTGTIDFGVSGFSYDPEKQVLFTDTYYDAGQTVLVLKDSRIEVFKKLSFDKMESIISDLESLLSEMKDIRKSKLEKEIQETEEKLKKLKGI